MLSVRMDGAVRIRVRVPVWESKKKIERSWIPTCPVGSAWTWAGLVVTVRLDNIFISVLRSCIFLWALVTLLFLLQGLFQIYV